MNNNQTNMNDAFDKWLKDNYPDYPPFPQDVWQAATKASESEINSLKERVAELEDKISIELKRVSALKSLRESYEKELEHYRKHDYSLAKSRLDTIEQSLNSEREMNQTLTNENMEIQAHVNQLREALEELLVAYRVAVKLYDSNHDDAYTVIGRNAIAKARNIKWK